MPLRRKSKLETFSISKGIRHLSLNSHKGDNTGRKCNDNDEHNNNGSGHRHESHRQCNGHSNSYRKGKIIKYSLPPVFESSSQLAEHNRSSTTFHLFGRLPPEIRYMIWKTACSEPRLIELTWKLLVKGFNRGFWTAHHYYHATPNSSKVPAILHALQEARGEALRFYQRRYFTNETNGSQETKHVYFNPRVDIIYFGYQSVRRNPQPGADRD
jgi:hypothetical protein